MISNNRQHDLQAHDCDQRNVAPNSDDLGDAQNQMVEQNSELIIY